MPVVIGHGFLPRLVGEFVCITSAFSFELALRQHLTRDHQTRVIRDSAQERDSAAKPGSPEEY